ncbi:zinc finger protein 385D-like isoform X3, partial [Lates japonicus]
MYLITCVTVSVGGVNYLVVSTKSLLNTEVLCNVNKPDMKLDPLRRDTGNVCHSVLPPPARPMLCRTQPSLEPKPLLPFHLLPGFTDPFCHLRRNQGAFISHTYQAVERQRRPETALVLAAVLVLRDTGERAQGRRHGATPEEETEKKAKSSLLLPLQGTKHKAML